MTTKADFTDEEWARLERAPFVAGMAISMADPGGPIEALKETMATVKTVTEVAQSGGRSALVDEIAKSIAARVKQRDNPLKDFRPKGAMAGEEIGINRMEACRRWLHELGLTPASLGGSEQAFHEQPSPQTGRARILELIDRKANG